MLQDSYFLAKIGADTAENEQQFPAEICWNFADRPSCRRTLELLEVLLEVPHRGGLAARGLLADRRAPLALQRLHLGGVENKEFSPNPNTGYQPNIKSWSNIDIPRITNLSWI